MSTISFAQHYSPDQYAAYMTAATALRADEKDKVTFKDWCLHGDILEVAVLSYLKARAEAGELTPVPFSDRRELRWVDAWNRMVKCEKPHRYDDTILREEVLMSLSLLDSRNLSYADMVEAVHKARLNCSAGECQATGETMRIRMKGWIPVLGSYESINGKHTFVATSKEAPFPTVQHLQIPVPSGELLIADWFRIDGFTDLVKAVKHPSLNTVSGQQQTSEIYAREFGFASVCVGNSSPSVFHFNGQMRIGSQDCEAIAGVDDPEGKNIGRVCTDLWWVSAIDREVLTEIVARTAGRKEAEKRVAEFIAEYRGDVTTVHLPAGQPLHVYFESEEGLQGRFEADGVNPAGFETLYAVLSSEPLEWSPVPVHSDPDQKRKMSP